MTNLTDKQTKTVEKIITRRLDATVAALNTTFDARLKIVEDENKKLNEGSLAHTHAGKATEQIFDFPTRGGQLINKRLISR